MYKEEEEEVTTKWKMLVTCGQVTAWKQLLYQANTTEMFVQWLEENMGNIV